jgi:hypothetical protein
VSRNSEPHSGLPYSFLVELPTRALDPCVPRRMNELVAD